MTISAHPLPVPLDDSEILQIAVAPRERLFPTLHRASAFAPLIVVCCVLPAFQLLTKPTLNEDVSLWGLRSLAVANATTFIEFIEPGINESGHPLIHQPPLSPWLNGLMIRLLGPSNPLASSFVPLVAMGISIWLMSRFAWRIGGASTALIAAFLLCSHPQVFEMSVAPSGAPIGFALMLACVFGFQRHLARGSVDYSLSLILSGVFWGLSLLAIGPVAFVVPLLFAIHTVNSQATIPPKIDDIPFRDRLAQSIPVLRAVLVFLIIGFVIGGWWEIFMLFQHGTIFWKSWWTSLPVECLAKGISERECDFLPLVRTSWHKWLDQNALILGWFVAGFERSWHEWCRPTNETSRSRFKVLVVWFALAFLGRFLVGIFGSFMVVNSAVWNVAVLAPMTLLAALGYGTLIERAISRRGEFFLVVLLVSLLGFHATNSWLIGMTAAAVSSTILICGPRLVTSTGRNENSWNEDSWRQLLQFVVYGSLLASFLLGFGLHSPVANDADRLADLRDRLKGFPDVRRISLIATRDPVPTTLKYLLRSRWPQAEIVTSEGWDLGLTQAMINESRSPQSRFLIIEWTRREVRLSVDTGQGWQMKSLGDPIRFYGRRLSLVMIEPQS